MARAPDGDLALADDLAACVHGPGGAEVAAEGAEVDHAARLGPGERVDPEGGGRALADHLPARVHCERFAEVAAERAEVDRGHGRAGTARQAGGGACRAGEKYRQGDGAEDSHRVQLSPSV